MKKSLSIRLLVINLVMILICITSIATLSYFFHRADTVNENSKRALDIVRSAVTFIEGDEFDRIMSTKEKDDYWYDAKAALDEIKINTGVTFLYAMDDDYTDTHVTFFAAGYNPDASWDSPRDLGFSEAILTDDGEPYYSELMFETLETGEDRKSSIYQVVGQPVISAFTAVKDSSGNVVGVLGVDINVEDALVASRMFALKMIIMSLIFIIAFSLISHLFVKRVVANPISSLTTATKAISEGDINIELNIDSEDEIGKLANGIRNMAQAFQRQSEALRLMADGDFTISIDQRGEKDTVNLAINNMSNKINASIREIKIASEKVSNESLSISHDAQDLAHGTTEQASAMEMLSEAINSILTEAQENTKKSEQALQYVTDVGAIMTESMNSMQNMISSMEEIDNTSRAISQILKVIDSIAFQTNILSLNAAIEAARAGARGKGFGVVASEVKMLADKSAQAAQETAEFIQNSIEKVDEGHKVFDKTGQSIDNAMELTKLCTKAVEQINISSRHQCDSIAEINDNVEKISAIIQSVSAKSVNEATTAKEMSDLSQKLNSVISQFVIES